MQFTRDFKAGRAFLTLAKMGENSGGARGDSGPAEKVIGFAGGGGGYAGKRDW
jgi:hypothetical protein